MPSRRDWWPQAMRRMAVVAPETRWRAVLVELGDLGRFEPDPPLEGAPNPLRSLAERSAEAADAEPVLSPTPVEPDVLASAGDYAALLGEASLTDQTAAALPAATCRVLPGWVRADDVALVRERLDGVGGTLVGLPGRPGLIPPTAHKESRAGSSLRPLVSTYATVPYRDIDPTLFAALAYMLMFGMMFGDVAHGLAIVAVGALALRPGEGRLARLRPAAPFLLGAGAAATGFGFLYGEAFGPTGLVPTVWLRPLDQPDRLLVAGLLAGGVLMSLTFLLAIVNRWREGGPALAIYDATGIPGALLLAAIGAGTLGATTATPWAWPAALVLGGVGVVLVFTGLVVSAGGRAAGVAEALVELFDTLLRLGSNLVSFTRLAAFGLTHAVISAVVWDGTAGLWDRGGPLWIALAAVLFAVGNATAFALGALVGAVQALRLEYYELFSRLFSTDGRAFTPWHVPVRRTETP